MRIPLGGLLPQPCRGCQLLFYVCLMGRLLVSEAFPPAHGGSGRWFWEVYRRLPREDYLIAADEHPRQDEFDRTHDLRVVRLPLAMRAWGLRSWAALSGYLTRARRLRRLM